MKKIILVAAALGLGIAGHASAASNTENTGVLGGAIAGAAAGGPVGLIIGAAIGGHYANVHEQKNQAAARANELDQNLSVARNEIDAAHSRATGLSDELARSRNQINERNTEIEELVRDQAMLAELKFDVLFRTNATELGEADTAQVTLLAKFLRRHPELAVRLHGHTDVRGGERYNDALSENRAQSVARLLAALDVDESRIEMHAYGESEALAGEGDLDGYARDRRVSVEFSVVDNRSPTVAHSD